MAEIIRRANDLPAWFDLSKYASSKTLDSSGWYEQLTVRKELLGIAGSPRWHSWNINYDQDEKAASSSGLHGHAYGDQPSIEEKTKYVMRLIQGNPIVDTGSDEMLAAFFFGGPLLSIKNRNDLEKYSMGVRLSTVRDIYLAERGIDRSKREYSRKYFNQYLSGSQTKELSTICEYVDWIDEPIDDLVGWDDVNIRVKMGLPDKVIIEQFKKLLVLHRENCKFKPVSRVPNFASWINFGVLPYLDLKIWAATGDVSIPNRVMADAIFPSGDGGEEVVRKTTEKLVDELFSTLFLTTLAALASNEKAGHSL